MVLFTEAAASVLPFDGDHRVVIESVTPNLEGGRFPIKRVPGEKVAVQAIAFADGHDSLSLVLKFRSSLEDTWSEVTMKAMGNDLWTGEFFVTGLGEYFYTVEGWLDSFGTWRLDLEKRIKGGQNVAVDLLIGAQMVREAASRAYGIHATQLTTWASKISDESQNQAVRSAAALAGEVNYLYSRYPDRGRATRYSHELRVIVDRALARTAAWYEIFPRSCPGKVGGHGTFKDVEAFLPKVAQMGFDVLYLPPIHPVGHSFRKGKNNNPECQPGEPGSPWGIGNEEGGHASIHPQLGTLSDFKTLVAKAQELKIEIALDIAFQCSPDHPWVREHPEWFRHRPDGTIQYAENPPKKYQDIYPLDFESTDWKSLWHALKNVIEYWIAQGVRIFRVDNPHTKSFSFWEWVIAEIRGKQPDVFFLAEAFTRPQVMYGLAKRGFNQSYNYFPWRNTKAELTEYFTELSTAPVADFFRANLWPNTPDILPRLLQFAGPAAFHIRLVLAATLGSSYGIYGPAFEMMENLPLKEGGEEYLNSEKYEIRDWDMNRSTGVAGAITHLNHIRRSNPALHEFRNVKFHSTDNDCLIAYSKASDDYSNVVLVIVNLDPQNPQSGWVGLDLAKLGLPVSDELYRVRDLLGNQQYQWRGSWNYVCLRPWEQPAHIFQIEHIS